MDQNLRVTLFIIVGLTVVFQCALYGYYRVALLQNQVDELKLQLQISLEIKDGKQEQHHQQQQQQQHPQHQHQQEQHLISEAFVSLPRTMDDMGNVRLLTFEERLRYLELKANTRFSWVANPYFGLSHSTPKRKCERRSNLSELPSGCAKGKDQCPGGFDHPICLDELPAVGGGKPCIALDFGIRENPEFGMVLAKDFKCQVYAFDPSPITQKWFPTSEVSKLPNYKYFKFGAGAVDGSIQLSDYDWDQVSILRAVTYKARVKSKTHSLEVKQLATILRELDLLGKYVDILKIDVEGSEFLFLQQAFDTMGCWPRFFGQITLEWHHYPWDVTYGGGASPVVNSMVALMEACDHEMFHLHSEGWESDVKAYSENGHHDVRYTLAGFRRKYPEE